MGIAVQCGCGKGFTARDEHAGLRAKCPECGARLVIPGPVPVASNGVGIDDDDAGVAPPLPPRQAVPAPLMPAPAPFKAPFDEAPQPEAPELPKGSPPEPWYFGWVVAASSALAFLGLLQLGIGCVVALAIGVSTPTPARESAPPFDPTMPVLLTLGSSAVVAVGAVTGAALMRLAVCLARNARAAAYGIEALRLGK